MFLLRGLRALLWLGLLGLAALVWWLWPSPPEPVAPPPPPLAVATPEPTPPALFVGRLALVIDDWGYQKRPLERLKSGLRFKMTAAVLPSLPYSKAAAEAAHSLGHEVILHLPMEAMSPVTKEAGTLLAGMPGPQARTLLEGHWRAVPHRVGLNNHEGSKASTDKALMAVVAAFIKEKNGYFLDSVTASKSAIPAAAKAAGLPWAKRRVFLDNVDEPGAIAKQLEEAVRIAKQTGSCIAIGHPRAHTLDVLEAAAPGLAAQGIELVPVSRLLQRP